MALLLNLPKSVKEQMMKKMTLYYVVKPWPASDTVVYVAGPFGNRTQAFAELSDLSVDQRNLEVVEQTVEVE
jgi:hypothetical protein